ncbi:hypothetical protein WA026_014611 [Henosepilachna vigintioctopunctata]|uniref:Uncharacterized protein n=1 Tax=Henosepilachna vigintioctopunctata TaxID=420089 RepID=A0AAW1VDN2_9CUCU
MKLSVGRESINSVLRGLLDEWGKKLTDLFALAGHGSHAASDIVLVLAHRNRRPERIDSPFDVFAATVEDVIPHPPRYSWGTSERLCWWLIDRISIHRRSITF